MAKKSKITRIPIELEKELINIKKLKKIKKNSEGYRQIALYSALGREKIFKTKKRGKK